MLETIAFIALTIASIYGLIAIGTIISMALFIRETRRHETLTKGLSKKEEKDGGK